MPEIPCQKLTRGAAALTLDRLRAYTARGARTMDPDDVLRRSRIVCLLSPIGRPEAEIAQNPGSISIIGHGMYRLLKAYGGFDRIGLYHPSYLQSDHDVLLVMMCLPDVPMSVLEAFKTVVYYFDDMNEWKAQGADYKTRFALVDLFLSPVGQVADRMNALGAKPSFHMPWSMPKGDVASVKSEKPSVLIDMDDRAFTRSSIASGFAFARLCLDADMVVFVFEKFRAQCPDDLATRITFLPFAPHGAFLRLLGRMWFYASGIKGSYEFCALESALLGCGLISLDQALLSEHARRRHFLAFELTHSIDDLRGFIAAYRPQEVIADAERLYPRDAVRKIKSILARFIAERQTRP